MLTLLFAVVSTAWGQTTGVIYFGTNNTKINGASVNGEDSQGNNWTITTVGTSYYGQNSAYSQVGSSNDPAESITFTTTLTSEHNITAFSAKFGGFSNTAGTITLKVDNTTVGTGNLNGNTDVIVESTSAVQGTVLTVTVTGISKGVKCYNISYTYENDQPTGDKYYVAGSWTSWAENKIQMTKKSDDTYTLTNQELEEGALFKIIKVSSDESTTVWCGGGNNPDDNYWITEDNHTDIPLNVGGGGNFYMKIAGTWTITVDPTGDTPIISVDGDWPEWEYYLLGDFNNWETSDSYKFSDTGMGTFTLNKPIQLGEKFKVYGKRGSEDIWYGAVSNGDFYVNADLVGTELSLTTENGGENFYMNLSNKNSYWTLEFDPANKTLVLGNFVSDVAELPFVFDGGRDDIVNTPGLTSSGLGSDYGSSPKLKFTAASNAVILHFDERPGTLSFDIKGNGFSGGTFQVLTSVNGEDYDVLKEYTSISAATTGQHETFDNLGENVRYIKWLYKTRSSGNVALGNIKLEEYVAPQSYTLTIDNVENGEVFVFYNIPDTYPEIASGDEVLESSEVLVSVSADEGYEIRDIAVTNANGQRLQLTEKEEGISWIFTMPSSNVTVSCTIEEINYDKEEWVLTDIAELTEDDIFVIVGNNGATYAMPNDKGTTPPDAVSVTVVQNKIISSVADRIKWNISGDATNGYIFRPNGDDENWLYLKDKNTAKGVCVGTSFESDEKHLFTIVDGYLYNEATERYVGIFSTQDWRCYTSITGTSNIAGQSFAFYKLIQPEKFKFSISEAAYDGTAYYATISALGEGNWKVVGDVEVSTVVVNNKELITDQFVATNGDLIPGNGAFLVKGAAYGDYSFEKSKNPKTIDIGDNMLLSTGEEGDIETVAPTGVDDNNKYYFYKLTLNKKKDPGSVGFYWGNTGGTPFHYSKGHQAYLAVPKDNALNVLGFSFDGTTGIAELETTVNGIDEVYTISGIRVDGSNLGKGVYIVNGKKVIIK